MIWGGWDSTYLSEPVGLKFSRPSGYEAYISMLLVPQVCERSIHGIQCMRMAREMRQSAKAIYLSPADGFSIEFISLELEPAFFLPSYALRLARWRSKSCRLYVA